MELLSIVDTAVKIGLGALISGVATYWVTKLNHENDIAKTKLKRQRELLEEIAGQVEEFSNAVLKYWAYMIEHVRYAERKKTAPENLPIRIKNAEAELFDKFSQLSSAEGKLILLGSLKAQELLREYGEFRFGEWNAKRGLQTGGRCEYCDRDLLASFNDYDSWQIDHVMPSSKGGRHEYENMAVCCKTCNFLKLDYFASGENRDERVADARRHVEALRVVREAELARIRKLIRGQLEMLPTG